MKNPMTTANSKKVLVIAYHYPPCAVSSGIQRTLSFTKHLSKYGWQPVVLTVNPKAYERSNPSQLKSIPPSVVVKRSLALDAARHLSLGGRYWSRLTIPDRWTSWWWSAVPTGLRLIKQHRIDAIWSTYPIATAHNIGATLARLSGLPWVADFRDPMVEYVERTKETYPKDPALRNARLAVEAKAAQRAARLVFCTDAARRIVAERYPDVAADRLAVITNGYDEEAFLEAEQQCLAGSTDRERKVLLHSGTIYPGTDRDPTPLLHAIKGLAERGVIDAKRFELRLRNPSAEDYLKNAIDATGIQSMVSILPPIPYRDALAEMLQMDGLLVLQGFTSNPAVPAKLYEYLRAQRPILGLVDPDGETAATLHTVGITTRNITDVAGITELLLQWLNGDKSHSLQAAAAATNRYSRDKLTAQLAQLLNNISDQRRKPR